MSILSLDDAVSCGKCEADDLDLVQVVSRNLQRKGLAVKCLSCGNRGTPKPTRHEAVTLWNLTNGHAEDELDVA